MYRQETFGDMACALAIGVIMVFVYVSALRSPEANPVNRLLHRYHGFWARSAFSLPARLQMKVLVGVGVVIAVGALSLLVIGWATGTLRWKVP